MDTNKAIKYGGAGLAVVAGVLVIAEAPLLCLGAGLGAYVYYKAKKNAN